jgi:hypothetical protein
MFLLKYTNQSNKRYCFQLLFLCILTANNFLFAQGTNSYPQLENCWQKIVVEGNGPFLLLKNSQGKAEFKITHSGNPTSFRYFQIWQKYKGSNTGQILDWSSLVDTGYQLRYFDVALPGDTARKLPVILNGPVAANNWNTRSISLDLNEYDEFRLNLFSENQAYPGGPLIINPIVSNALLKFVNISDYMTIRPKEGTCHTFSSFNFDVDFSLPGFCGTFLKGKLRLANPNSPNNMGLPPNWQSSDLYKNDPVLFAIPQSCGDTLSDPCLIYGNPPYPVPCKCVEFIMDFEILPCTENEDICPNLFGSIPIKICCKCDGTRIINEQN